MKRLDELLGGIGLGTRAVGGPVASRVRGPGGLPLRFVPLSKFFADRDGGKKQKGEKVIMGKAEPKKKGQKGNPGAHAEALLPVKAGATGMTHGVTGSGNVPAIPTPIGAGDGRKFLDYAGGHPFKKRRKKKAKLPALRRG